MLKTRKLLALALALMTVMSLFPLTAAATGPESAATLIADTTTLAEAFPDANFRTYVAQTVLGNSGYDDGTGKDTTLTQANINTIKARTSIDVNSKSISSLAGVEHFIALTTLFCNFNQLTELDVSKNTGLTWFECRGNRISDLDVSALVNLLYLACYDNLLGELDITHNTKLIELWCMRNQLTELDVTANTALKILACYTNQISELDVSKNTALTRLDCGTNQISELDLSALVNLTTLQCYSNKLSTLDVSERITLTYLNCYSNQLTELDISKNTNLTTLQCYNNQLTELDVSENTSLTTLNCQINQLSELDLSQNTELVSLNVTENPINVLDISGLSKLTSINASRTPISELNFHEDALNKITELYYRGTNIETMDLAGFTFLKGLSVTKSTNADLSNLTSLFISGTTRAWNDFSVVRLAGNAGAFSRDEDTRYYIVASEGNASYGFTIPYGGSFRSALDMATDQYTALPDGGLVDDEGNLVVGATLADVDADGTITLEDGGVIVTAEGTYTFTGLVVLKGTEIRTENDFTYDKNVAEYDPETRTGTVLPPIHMTFTVGNGEAVTNTVGGDTVIVPPGSVVTPGTDEDEGLFAVELPDDGGTVTVPPNSQVEEDGNNIKITLPGEDNTLGTNDDITVIVPPGSTVNADGTVVTPQSGDPGGSPSVTYYTVRFETNGGGAVAGQSVAQNGRAVRPADPAKDGYTFGGWFSDTELTKAYDFNTAVTANMTLYAKWTQAGDGWQNPFTDVKEGDWFYGDVAYVHTNGLFNGTSATTFSPNTPMTRAMLVTVLFRIADPAKGANTTSFTDVPLGQWYSDAIAWAAQNGIVKGVTETQFAPDVPIIRQDIAVILERYMSWANIQLPVTAEYRTFADEDEIGGYAKNAVQLMNKLGVINGRGERNGQSVIDPTAPATRAEVAAMLHRFLTAVSG